jgi:general L-amino acid transport system permease protein
MSMNQLILSVITLALVMPFCYRILNWAIFNATFLGTERSDCTGDGACWIFIKARLSLFMFGFYPEEELYRALIMVGCWAIFFAVVLYRRHVGIYLTLAIGMGLSIASYWILKGGVFGLTPVDASQWGGMTLTLWLTLTGSFFAMPIAIILATARTYGTGVFQMTATATIEACRGVPLITLLFLGSIMLPLFLPNDVNLSKVVRIGFIISLFTGCYIAEALRGGFQTLPHGQIEGASALGFSFIQTLRHILLPQALRVVVPSIANSIISMAKDTSLVLIVGMMDFMGMIQTSLSDPQWLGLSKEAYVFAGLCYLVLGLAINRGLSLYEIDSGHGSRYPRTNYDRL